MEIRKKRGLALLLFVLLGIAGYTFWALSGRGLAYSPADLHLALAQEVGRDVGAGNLVAIEPWMTPGDYSSEMTFRARLRGYFEEAKARGWLGHKTVVVLPEYLGTWLVAANEKASVYSAKTKQDAMVQIALSNLPPTLYGALKASSADRIRAAILSFKAKRVADIYDRCLSSLATEYRVTLVGGSVLLPNPSVRNGRLTAGEGELYNASALYRPTGVADPQLSVKCFPTKTEKPFVARGNPSDLPVYDTPVGRLGVLVCADSWFPRSYEELRKKKAEIIASPTYGPNAQDMNQTWEGYSGWPNPDDIDSNDPGHITEGEAMLRYGLGGKLSARDSGFRCGTTACLSGQLWDERLDSLAITVTEGRLTHTAMVEGASIVCVWLPPRKK